MTTKIIKELSIQVDLNGLSFCILNALESEIIYFNRIVFDSKLTPFDTLNALKAELSSNTVFADDFKSVLLIHQNELSTLVPKALYDESNNADYLKFNSKILQTDFIAQDDLNSINAINVYVPYVNINNYIFETFGAFTYKHASSIFVERIIEHNSNTEDTLFINVEKNVMEILIMKNNQLQLFNRFEFTTVNDFLYYVLFVVEQLQLDPEKLIVKLCGAIKHNDQLYESLYKYIRHVDFIESKSNLRFDSISAEDRLPNNFTILNSF